MIDSKLLDILCCPESKQNVLMASAEILANINQGIQAGNVKNKAGEVISETIDEALISEDGKRLYPVRHGIPVMLIDESIILE